MEKQSNEPHVLFLSPDGQIYPDTMICSGTLPPVLHGQICPFSQNGRMPAPGPLSQNNGNIYSIDKGKLGDLCPPCAKQQLGALGHWQGHNDQSYPDELLPLRLFKCRQWFWFVIPGLRDDAPTEITPNQL